MSFICPKGCGKKFTTENFMKRHVEVMHKEESSPAVEMKRKGWATPYGFVDFKEPVSYEEACESSKVIHEMLMARHAEKNTTDSKGDSQ